MPAYGFLSGVWPFSQQVRIKGLQSYIDYTHAEPWHLYAIQNRYKRYHVCMACNWLYKILPDNARIFEPGCGSGINLLWFGQRNFQKLHGADVSQAAVDLCILLAKHLGITVNVWRDNCCKPQKVPEPIDGLLSVNWLYHIDGASLEQFFEAYRPFMACAGKIAFDVVDASYNQFTGNQYHTDDLTLPKAQRRCSEYKLRLSQDEVKRIIKRHNCTLLKFSKAPGNIPRTVWLIQTAAS